MKKKFFVFLLVVFSLSTIIAEENSSAMEEKKSEEITSLYLKTGLSFTYFSINGNEFYNYYDSSYAPTIVEIITVDKDLYKVVYAEPLNKAGALRYVTLYLETGDLVAIGLHDIIAAGKVLTGKANLIELKGIIKE